MKKTYLTRPQIALVLIGHVFEELDVHDLEELITKVTCSDITFDEEATAKGEGEDLWQSDKPFEELADSSLPKLLDYLKDVLKR